MVTFDPKLNSHIYQGNAKSQGRGGPWTHEPALAHPGAASSVAGAFEFAAMSGRPTWSALTAQLDALQSAAASHASIVYLTDVSSQHHRLNA